MSHLLVNFAGFARAFLRSGATFRLFIQFTPIRVFRREVDRDVPCSDTWHKPYSCLHPVVIDITLSVMRLCSSSTVLPFYCHFPIQVGSFLSSDYSTTSTWKLWRDLDDTTVDDSHRCSSPLHPCDLPKRYSSFRNSCNSHSHSGAQSFASSPSLTKRAHFHFLSNSLSSLLFDVWFSLCPSYCCFLSFSVNFHSLLSPFFIFAMGTKLCLDFDRLPLSNRATTPTFSFCFLLCTAAIVIAIKLQLFRDITWEDKFAD